MHARTHTHTTVLRPSWILLSHYSPRALACFTQVTSRWERDKGSGTWVYKQAVRNLAPQVKSLHQTTRDQAPRAAAFLLWLHAEPPCMLE